MPGGTPHQVRNLRSCTKVGGGPCALEFMTLLLICIAVHRQGERLIADCLAEQSRYFGLNVIPIKVAPVAAMQIALDFVTPEALGECMRLREDFRCGRDAMH